MAFGNSDLRMNQIHSGHQFGHRMLHLETSVHFQEKEIAALLQQELHGSGASVGNRPSGFDRSLPHRLAKFGIDRDGRRFLNDFLVTPLKRAFTLAQRHHVSVLIPENLDFNVPGLFDVALHVDGTSPKLAVASDVAARYAAGNSSGTLTIRIPLPPPPADALSMTG